MYSFKKKKHSLINWKFDNKKLLNKEDQEENGKESKGNKFNKQKDKKYFKH